MADRVITLYQMNDDDFRLLLLHVYTGENLRSVACGKFQPMPTGGQMQHPPSPGFILRADRGREALIPGLRGSAAFHHNIAYIITMDCAAGSGKLWFH
jgi:hypothetical protein